MVVRNDDSSSVYLFILEEDHEDNRDGLVVSRHESLSYDYLRFFCTLNKVTKIMAHDLMNYSLDFKSNARFLEFLVLSN